MVALACLFLGQLAALATPDVGVTDRRIAVLEFRAGRGKVETDALKLLSDKARGGALEAVRGDRFLIVTRETQETLLRQQGVCNAQEGECDLETGRNLQAHYFLTGDVLEIGGVLHLTLKLFETSSGRFLAEETVKGAGVGTLVDGCASATTALVKKGLGSAGGGGIVFAQGVNVQSPPKVRVPEGLGDGVGADAVRAEELLERALEAQDRPGATAEEQAGAWCELSAVDGVNPYQGLAQQACARWSHHVEQLEQVEASVETDWDTVNRFLQLRRKTTEQKLSVVDAFLKAYRWLPDNPRVREARAIRASLVGEKPTNASKASPRAAPGKKVPATRAPEQKADPAPGVTVVSIILRALAWTGAGMAAGGTGLIALGIFVVVGFGIASIWLGLYGLIGIGGGVILLGLPGAILVLVGGVAAAAAVVTMLVD
jgi:TolB-like protein